MLSFKQYLTEITSGSIHFKIQFVLRAEPNQDSRQFQAEITEVLKQHQPEYRNLLSAGYEFVEIQKEVNDASFIGDISQQESEFSIIESLLDPIFEKYETFHDTDETVFGLILYQFPEVKVESNFVKFVLYSKQSFSKLDKMIGENTELVIVSQPSYVDNGVLSFLRLPKGCLLSFQGSQPQWVQVIIDHLNDRDI